MEHVQQSVLVLLLQVLCHLFHLQLAVMQFDRQAVSAITSSVTEVLQQIESQQEQQQSQEQLSTADMHLAQLKLHFLMLQFMYLVQNGSFKELQGEAKEQKGQQQGGGDAAQAQSITEQMDELLEQLQDSQQQQAGTDAAAAAHALQPQPYEWLPKPMMAAGVCLLAAVLDKNGGKQKQGQARIAKGGCCLSGSNHTLKNYIVLLGRRCKNKTPNQHQEPD
jgi:hypothetical protein